MPPGVPAGVPTTTEVLGNPTYTPPVPGVAAPSNDVNGITPPVSEGLNFNSASSTMVSTTLAFMAGLVFFIAI